MRIYAYKRIYPDLKILISKESFRNGNIDELKTVSLAEKFANKPPA
ncbi:MAG: hypothetical protein LC117_06100 [Bacteroidia bacterium]|nr:hypothetical protein [Bacteroidia bacterium]MCZ2277482.1 hypothetical protein [Bacteroidia bacterium]